MREDAPPTFFSTFAGDEEFVALHVRARIADSAMMRQIRALLASTGPGLAPVSLATMEQEIETSLWQERMLSFLSQVFGGLAVVIASIGCFALIAYTLSRRTREVGIRVALGATPRRIAALFAGFVCVAVLPGAVLGSIGFLATQHWLAALLYGSGKDAAVPLAGGCLVIALAITAAVAHPVIRAALIQPSVALREE
jgi:ABC-type antimicrobial peptide transport system permease subunit